MRVEANFAAAGLSHYYTDLFLGDNSRSPLRSAVLFDAIVTDRMFNTNTFIKFIY